MTKTGIANLPLHYGKAPKWLFKRMVSLSESIIDVIIHEFSYEFFLNRLSDPFWFQALSCVLGYDWHSSGTTTVTCGALKEATKNRDFGLAITGGKGKASKNTLYEIEKKSELFNLSLNSIKKFQYFSRMSAKIDNTAIQDGFNLYHHVFIFTEDKLWAVIQQGLNSDTKYARRYHWLSKDLKSFIIEPHKSILCDKQQENVLDMTSKKSIEAQNISVDLVNDNPNHLKCDFVRLSLSKYQKTLYDWNENFNNHPENLYMPRNVNWLKMKEIYEFQPKNYEELLSIKGVGPNTIRALALISDLIYGEKPSWSDPVKYSFTVGGKDGVPYPVDGKAMDQSIEILNTAIKQAKIGDYERIQSIKRLRRFVPATQHI